MANVFLDAGQTGYNIGNSGDVIYGNQGEESVFIGTGITGVVLDQNIEQVSLDGNVADFTYQQQGNRLLVYTGTDLVLTIPVQTDQNGTRIGFDDGVYSAGFEGAILELGGAAVPSDDPGQVVPVDDPSDFTPVDIDTGTLQVPAVFDAADGAFNFMDDAAEGGSVVINNVSDDDIISFSNADVSDYIFQHEDTDVTLSYNYNDEAIMNIIKLAGVVSSDDLVHDQASLSTALGFDAFGG